MRTIQQPGEIPRLERLAQGAAEKGYVDEAISYANTIIGLQPGHAEAHNFIGTMFSRSRRTIDAFRAYSRAIELDRLNFRAFSNISITLNDIDKFDAAVASALAAIEIAPDFEDAYMNLASIYVSRGRLEDAVDVYYRLMAARPDSTAALIEVHFLLLLLCDWDRIAAVQNAIMKGTTFLKDPRQVWGFTPSPLLHHVSARVWAENYRTVSAAPLACSAPPASPRRERPLRIGYLSADFKYHATAMLIVELLELHDRTQFETFGYCISLDDDSPLRRRIKGAFDHFVDLTRLADGDAAQRIRADEIDILIDLMGYTKTARTGIVARRPAPIQVNYLGFPGTMAADFIDYVIADDVVLPPGTDAVYDEKIVRLPFCYQPNDRQRQIAATPPRSTCALPDEAFVFCCFNSAYKITPAMFAVWMRLLAAVPHAVLWLLEDSESVARNLRLQAARSGVEPGRIVFGSRMENSAHLARLRCADLFLDTLPVTAHTTASDAVWAGLPLLTCLEEAFVSRVAASVLYAVGLPELVAQSLADYERLALHYARQPHELSRLRESLRGVASTPLFDTPRYVRHYEEALTTMAALRDSGRPPEAFRVAG